MTKVTSVLRLSYKFRGVKNKCSYRHTYKWHPLFLIHKNHPFKNAIYFTTTLVENPIFSFYNIYR